MWIVTTAGFLEVTSNGQTLRVRTPDKESADALADGVELVVGELRPVVLEENGLFYVFNVPREWLAEYVAHEIENYIEYPDFIDAVLESRGQHWKDQLMAMGFHIGELGNDGNA